MVLLLPDGRDRTHRDRPGGRDAGAQSPDATWRAGSRPRRNAVYAGEPAGQKPFGSGGRVGHAWRTTAGSCHRTTFLSWVRAAGKTLAGSAAEDLLDWLKAGGHLLAIGLDQADADALLPFKVGMNRLEHIAAFFEPPGFNTLLTGIGPADVHNRDPRELPLVATGAQILGDGVPGEGDKRQRRVLPARRRGSSTADRQSNLKRTQRRRPFWCSRLLANLGVAVSTPLLDRFRRRWRQSAKAEQRWLTGFYLDQPEEWDDPYRFFRW